MLGTTHEVRSANIPEYIGEINQTPIRKFSGAFNVVSYALGFSCNKLMGVCVSWRDTAFVIIVLVSFVFKRTIARSFK